jgi:uncharacterized protein (TIGR02646 family)
MIRVRRPTVVPAVLLGRGAAATKKLCDDYTASPASYTSGAATFTFDSGIYGHEEVKIALRQAQHDKCAFCESKVTHISYGDIEHFRPKAAVRQRPGGPLVRPGYYWLAYEWTNLFVCCQLCNQRFKENLFPLRRPGRRARSHNDDTDDEEPLFLNPEEEDPSRILRFRDEHLEPVRVSRRGRTTIDALGLNRPELLKARQTKLAVVKILMRTQRRLAAAIRQDEAAGRGLSLEDRTLLAEVAAHLAAMSRDSAEYAAMVRAALK